MLESSETTGRTNRSRYSVMALFSRRCVAGLLVSVCLAAFSAASAQDRSIVMASATSPEHSGLFAHLLPAFTKSTGIAVRVIAVGVGQALDIGRRGDADVLFVHDPAAEEKFVAEGFGLKRSKVMYDDFVLVGPSGDPAGVKGNDIVAALKKLSNSKASFVSRGDRSGTHAAELRYWKAAGVDAPASRMGTAYKECGCGMGPALNVASSSDAYPLTDRGTWISFKNRGKLGILVQGDKSSIPRSTGTGGRTSPRRLPTGCCHARGRTRSRATRSAASSRSSRTLTNEPASRRASVVPPRRAGRAPQARTGSAHHGSRFASGTRREAQRGPGFGAPYRRERSDRREQLNLSSRASALGGGHSRLPAASRRSFDAPDQQTSRPVKGSWRRQMVPQRPHPAGACAVVTFE
jgi:tungstate transport system substrate-binding protein